MFYATQIKSIDTNGVIDIQGKRLTFIGSLPVKVGDTVYTDGSVIFGNAPPKGSPVIFEQQIGIPILGEESFIGDSGGKELRGYFRARNGDYKKYSIAQDDWIVNSKKKFLHGENTISKSIVADSEATIIDAYIADNGDEFITTNGFYQSSKTLDLVHVAIEFKDSRTWGGEIGEFGNYTPYHTRWEIPRAVEHTLGVKTEEDENAETDKKQDVKIMKNWEDVSAISLVPYAQDAKKRALQCASELMEQSFEQDDIYPYLEFEGKEYNAYWQGNSKKKISTRPSAPIITHAEAYVLTSIYNETGINGTVFATACGYCFPYIKSRLKYSFNNRKFLREWKCVPFGVSCIYDMSVGKIEPIIFRHYGGIDSNVSVFGDDEDGWLVDYVYGPSHGTVASLTGERHIKILTTKQEDEQEDEKKMAIPLTPIGEHFFSMDKFGRLSFYDSKKKKLAEKIPVHDDFYHIEIGCGFFQPELYLYLLGNKADVKYKGYKSNGTVEEKTLGRVNGEVIVVIRNDAGEIIKQFTERVLTLDKMHPIDGYYIKKYNLESGETDSGDETDLNNDYTLEPLHFTPLFYQLKDGSYIYGVKGGKLYHQIKDNEPTLIGDGIKNFRLRELKNINKAKR